MTDPIAKAVEHAVEFGGGPERTWQVDEDDAVEFGTNPYNPFDGATFTHWTRD